MGFWVALRFLTVLPAPWGAAASRAALGCSQSYFPLVGLLLGAILVALDVALSWVLPRPLGDALLVAALAVLTGALHLEGFVDTCDGLGSTKSPAERLAIMRDSRVGAFGVVGVVTLLLAKYAALVSLPEEHKSGALLMMPVVGSWAMVYAIFFYPYGRAQEGVGKIFKDHASWGRLLMATAIALVVCLAALQVRGIGVAIGAWLVLLVSAWLVLRRIPGLTGDVYGALNEVTQVVVLVLATVRLPPL